MSPSAIDLDLFHDALEKYGYVEEVMDDVVTGVTFTAKAPLAIWEDGRIVARGSVEALVRGLAGSVLRQMQGRLRTVEFFLGGWWVMDSRDFNTMMMVARNADILGAKNTGIVSVDNWRGPYRLTQVQ